MLKLIRLLRLSRIFTLMRLREEWQWLKNLPIIMGYLLLIHWIGCMWYFLINETDWIPPYYLNEQTLIFKEQHSRHYTTTFYYGMEVLLGNEIAPINFSTYIAASLFTIVGAMFYAFLFGTITATTQAMQRRSYIYEDKLDMVQRAMISIALPETTQAQVLDYIDILHENASVDQTIMDEFFKLLSISLKLRTKLFLCNDLFKASDSPLYHIQEADRSLILSNCQNKVFKQEERIVY